MDIVVSYPGNHPVARNNIFGVASNFQGPLLHTDEVLFLLADGVKLTGAVVLRENEPVFQSGDTETIFQNITSNRK